ncbi:dermonecrotic toxin domain-containing protein [Pseudomonas sp. NPDC007930]|uniref:dermonecrotic toxin domain-containing protein n=1 Tax=Pseudomonas sp. NPDC007930 TaxID=3364417 RepID=UPI0036EC7601
MTTLHASHLALIQRQAPAWLLQASTAERAVLAERLRHSHRAQRELAKALGAIQPVHSYCQPLLETALADWFSGEALPPVAQAQVVVHSPRQYLSWLEAALQNVDAGAALTLYASERASAPLSLDAARFASGLRNLDLGQRYQDHLADHLDTDHFHSVLSASDRASFAAELSLARLSGRIDAAAEALGEAALLGASEVPTLGGEPQALQCQFLSLFGIALDGPLLLRLAPRGATEPCLLYVPGDPHGAMSAFESLQAAGAELTRRLWQEPYRVFFCRFVGHTEQAAFAARLRSTLYPRYPYAALHRVPPVLRKGDRFSWIKRAFPSPRDLWQETLDQNARLLWEATPWPGDCFAARARAGVARRRVDAAAIAVPVAQRDAAAQRQRLEGWLGLGLSVLNVAGLFVPALGEVMLVIGGAQLVGEFLEGVHAANEGDADAAIAHLFEVLENLAQVAVLGAAHAAAAPLGVLDAWAAVPASAGERLWHGRLAPFSRPLPWPEGTVAGADGLLDWQGERWLAQGSEAYPLERAGPGRWQARAASGHGHRPTLQGNGSGAWWFGHERPMSWGMPELLQRLGPASAGLSEAALQQALACSSYDAAALRRLLANQEATPALLLDTLEAFTGTAPAAPAVLPQATALARDFPRLSPRAVNEIASRAAAADQHALWARGRVPLRMAESARLYLREGRINRALARFYQTAGASQDRDALAIGWLGRLPGASGEVRVVLREGSLSGDVLASSGPEAAAGKAVVRTEEGYVPYDESGQALASPLDLYQAVLNALPDSERVALGLEIHAPDGLRDALFSLASGDREASAVLLGMAPLRPLYRLPTRVLGERRWGYRLSGRGRGWLSEDELFDELFPSSEGRPRQALRQRLRAQAGQEPAAFGRLLEGLRQEYRQLNEALDRWAADSHRVPAGDLESVRLARRHAAVQLRMAWRRESLGEPNGTDDFVVLRLDASHLGALPTLPVPLPHVRQLILSGSRAGEASNLGGFLSRFPGVRQLDISNNLLRWLPEEVASMAELHSLDLADNYLPLDHERNLAVLARLPGLQRLNLSGAVENLPVAALQRLGGLPQLRTLSLDLNGLELSAEHFEALRQWPALLELSASGNGITLTEASRTALAGLNRLEVLLLEENSLELAPDVTGWLGLRVLDLGQAEISEWPAGLLELLQQRPLRLQALDLSGNSLSSAPALRDTAFAEGVLAGEASYDFDGNLFDEASLRQLAAAGLPAIPREYDVAPWYADLPEAVQLHRAATLDDPAWQPIYALFERMVDTPDYLQHTRAVQARMAHILETLSAAETDAVPGWGRAQLHEGIIEELNDAAQGCVDQAALLFQRIDTEVLVWRSVAEAAPGASSDQVAVDVATALLRQGRLDERVGQLYNARVARRRALAAAEDDAAREAAPPLHGDDDMNDTQLTEPDYLIDEIEMALAARQQLRQALHLPAQPEQILFGDLARLSDATLHRLGEAVLAEVNAHSVAIWAVDQRFWRAWMRRLRPQAFSDLALEWEGASAYFTDLSEAAEAGPYAGAAVPLGYVQALEGELAQVAWRIDGVLQRVDLVSGRYEGESALYERAAQLLLSSREDAENVLLRDLTIALAQAHWR